MAKERKDLPVVHLEVDAIDGLEAVRVRLRQVCHLQVLVVELEAGNLWRYRLVVALVHVLDLEWIDDSVASVFQSASPRDLLLREGFRLDIMFLLAAATAAKAAAFPLTVGARKNLVKPGSEQQENPERKEHHGQSRGVSVVVDRFIDIFELETGL